MKTRNLIICLSYIKRRNCNYESVQEEYISEKIKMFSMFNIVYGSRFELFPCKQETRWGKLTLHVGCSSEKNCTIQERLYSSVLQRLERQVEIKILYVAVARGALNFEPLRDTST